MWLFLVPFIMVLPAAIMNVILELKELLAHIFPPPVMPCTRSSGFEYMHLDDLEDGLDDTDSYYDELEELSDEELLRRFRGRDHRLFTDEVIASVKAERQKSTNS
jgi:hypothetical protein